MSNYPAGVTGREYAISGPDEERETTEECSLSYEEEEGTEYRFGFQRWFVCDKHNHTTDLPDLDDEPDPDEARDRAIDRQLDREY